MNLSSREDILYKQLATSYLRVVRWHSPETAALLEKISPFGTYATYKAALAILVWKSAAERTNGAANHLPQTKHFDHFLQQYPDALPLLHDALDRFMQDWPLKRSTPNEPRLAAV